MRSRIGFALVLAIGWLACDGSSQRDLVLITIDTLRADHLGIYGYERDTTPSVDRWFAEAAGGAIFERSYSTDANTPPSVVSILSGQLPQDHGVREFYQLLPAGTQLVSDRLPDSYQTAAFVSNMVLTDEAIGLRTRFDHYDDFVAQRESRRRVFERNARRTTDSVLAWIARDLDPTRPVFLWVHYIDPHGPYRPPKDWPFEFVHEGKVTIDPERVPKYQREPGVTDGETYVDRYDEEIRFVDAEIDRLLSGFSKLRSLDDSLLLLTADHGESMMEHERWFTHGYQVYDEIVRVPLLLRGPGVESGRYDEVVSGLDVAPTLLGFALGSVPPDLGGADLRRGSMLDPQRVVYAEAANEENQWRMAVRGRGKWVMQLIADRRLPRFYDLRLDPNELRPGAWPTNDPTAGELLALIDRDVAGVGELDRGKRLRSPKISPDASEEDLAALRALGYVE